VLYVGLDCRTQTRAGEGETVGRCASGLTLGRPARSNSEGGERWRGERKLPGHPVPRSACTNHQGASLGRKVDTALTRLVRGALGAETEGQLVAEKRIAGCSSQPVYAPRTRATRFHLSRVREDTGNGGHDVSAKSSQFLAGPSASSDGSSTACEMLSPALGFWSAQTEVSPALKSWTSSMSNQDSTSSSRSLRPRSRENLRCGGIRCRKCFLPRGGFCFVRFRESSR